MPQNTHINAHPDNQQAIQDIIGNPPGCLLHTGIACIGLMVAVLLLLANFIEYPDKIIGKGVITTASPPLEIVSPISGDIEVLHVNNKNLIEAGDTLLYIKNDAAPNSIRQATQAINKLKNCQYYSEYMDIRLPAINQLGEVQAPYATLKRKFDELRVTLGQSGVNYQVKNIGKRIKKIRQLNSTLSKEREIFYAELQLKDKNYRRQVGLNTEGVISELELENIHSELLQYQRQYESMSSDIIQNEINIEQLDQEAMRLSEDRKSGLTSITYNIKNDISTVESAIKNWHQKYYLISNQGGILSLPEHIKTNAHLKRESVIAHIIPTDSTTIMVKVMTPVNASGKITVGQEILIKLPAYPYKEYGMLITTVAEILTLPIITDNGTFYEVHGVLPDTLTTNYNKSIAYKPNMPIIAEIITEDMTIFQRLFDQLLSSLRN